MNVAVITGNLTRDPELRTTASGKNVVNFTLAVDREYKNAEGNYPVDYIDIVAWGTLALSCATNLSKGRKVGVIGRNEVDTFTGSNGGNRKKNYINASMVDFSLSRKTRQDGTAPMPQTPGYNGGENQYPSAQQAGYPQQTAPYQNPPQQAQQMQQQRQQYPQQQMQQGQQPQQYQQQGSGNISNFPQQAQQPGNAAPNFPPGQQDYQQVTDVAALPY